MGQPGTIEPDDVDNDIADVEGGPAYPNGVNPATGGYAMRPLPPSLLVALAEQRQLSAAELDEIALAVHEKVARLGIEHDDDALDTRGWGVVFAADDPLVDEKRRRLETLLEHRRGQAGSLYKEFSAASGLQTDERGRRFLNRHGAAAGPVDPRRVPYYLLLVGSATDIPFAAQTEIDSRHAVGRVDFDSLDDLERYAQQLVARETSGQLHAKRAAFFAPANPGDVNTSRSAKRLAKPAADQLAADCPAWAVERAFVADATKARLSEWLANSPPSLLFTASHGLALNANDPAQREQQGALVTQQWPGPLTGERRMSSDEFFAASDLPAGASLHGMLAFLFACFGGGTPRYDEFLHYESAERRALADAPFVARLPQRLLAAGASAVIGHVERAWSCSFLWAGAGSQTKVFTDMLQQLASGRRVGAAAQLFNDRCNQIAFELANALKDRRFGLQNDEEVAGLWLAQTDAQNYAVLGDPAAKLNT